jgi:hypothetical protein
LVASILGERIQELSCGGLDGSSQLGRVVGELAAVWPTKLSYSLNFVYPAGLSRLVHNGGRALCDAH